MRRFLALILMLIIPLQVAWSAASGLYGHMDDITTAVGFHSHDHDHDSHDPGHSGHVAFADGGSMGNSQNDDGRHGSHCHHVLPLIPPESSLMPGLMPSGGPIPHPPAAFFTRTPLLFDRPPLAFS